MLALGQGRSLPDLAAAALLVGAGAAAGSVPARALARAVRLVLVLVLITAGINLFLTPGELLFRLGPLTATREGWERGILLAGRLALLALAGALVTGTTPPLLLSRGLERLLAPLGRLGVRVPDLSLILAIAIQFIPILLDEARRLLLARRGRAATAGTGWPGARLAEVAAVLVPLFVSALRRADRLADAMEARGYGRGPRGSLTPLRWRGSDWLVVAAPLALAVWLGISG